MIARTDDDTNSAKKDGSIIKIEDLDWRVPIIAYLKDRGRGAERNIRYIAFIYVLIDDGYYHRTAKDSDQARVAMGKVHEGICGTRHSTPKMKWLLRRASFYWPIMMTDWLKYYKGCEKCQRFGDLQLMPTVLMHPIIKPWSFQGRRLDFIGQIDPPSSKGHRFVLVAMDDFTKLTEIVPLKNMTHREVIEFITEHIIHRFGIPQTLTTDQGSS